MPDPKEQLEMEQEPEHFPVEPRYHPIHKITRKIYDSLASARLAMVLLVLAKGKVPADGLQLKVRLFSAVPLAVPVVRSMSVTYSSEVPKKTQPSTGVSTNWNTLLDVPECSQMVYPDGGNVWCSPTSISMVLR